MTDGRDNMEMPEYEFMTVWIVLRWHPGNESEIVKVWDNKKSAENQRAELQSEDVEKWFTDGYTVEEHAVYD